MTRPKLLDLFCGAGGAAVGYHRAGFDVVGVDIKPQPRYPFEFICADALSTLAETAWVAGFDAVHASPPCQAYSSTRRLRGVKKHPELVMPVRDALRQTGLPWVIENVPGAPLSAHVILCGSMFGLVHGEWELRRHRLFEISGFFCLTPPCQHGSRYTMSIAGNFQAREARRVLGVYGNGGGQRPTAGRHGTTAHIAQARALMDIPWMTQAEICQAIPPAYTEHIGAALLEHLAVTPC